MIGPCELPSKGNADLLLQDQSHNGGRSQKSRSLKQRTQQLAVLAIQAKSPAVEDLVLRLAEVVVEVPNEAEVGVAAEHLLHIQMVLARRTLRRQLLNRVRGTQLPRRRPQK